MAEKNLSVDWKKYYADHLVDMHTASMQIKPGDCVWLGQACSIPYALLDEMYTHYQDYHDVILYSNVMNRPVDMLFDPEVKKHIRQITTYNLPLERMSIEMNVMECGGMAYDLLQVGPFQYGCDFTAMCMCPPDEEGYCNLGVYGISTSAVLQNDPRIKKRIGVIDKNQYPMPGDPDITRIHVSELDWIVECEHDTVAIPAQPPTQVDKLIASYILPYIHPGDKVQIGFGGLGEEILAHLKSIGQLEVYSEVACDNMAQLCEEGVLTKIVCSSPGACSERFFKFASEDDRVTFRSQPDMVDPLGVIKQENLVAINATFMCDLIGQCCSEAQGLQPYSGPGGSFAYIYGAIRAKNGRSFICLRSTYKDHDGVRHSNILPWLPEGVIVTTPKVYVMYLVTEYGIADVFCKTLKDRIKAVLKIAHPDFRQELKDKIVTTPLIKEDDFEGYELFDNVK